MSTIRPLFRALCLLAILCLTSVAGRAWAQSAAKADLASALAILDASSLPSPVKAQVHKRIDAATEPFLRYLSEALADREADPMLLFRVDKARALPEGFAPGDLVSLDGVGLSVSRAGFSLRRPAFLALKDMSAAARAEGVTLLVSSSYRSYSYQVEVWKRGVAADGLAATEASVARAGHSQHQLGTAIDFGSITDAFAQTRASRWLSANSRRFGFSLSFPKDLTPVTGYKWESWHYRYIGRAAAAMEGEYFDGVQEYLLAFLEGF